MWRTPSEAAFEAVARDPAVRAGGERDRLTTNARLGQGLQRLYEPVRDPVSERLGSLLTLVDQDRSTGR
jgi:hypothetical protein